MSRTLTHMPAYANQTAFEMARSRLAAIGTDLSPDKAIVDTHGNVLARARTGGMLDPKRHALEPGTVIYRFGQSRLPREVARGGWWIEKREFQQLVDFAIAHDIYLGMAMRVLCLVPPEWNKATMLVRGRVDKPLLAWRGLANSVVTPMKGGKDVKGMVRLPHRNDISARRVHQLYIPGLDQIAGYEPAVAIEDVRELDEAQSKLGFLYL